VINIRIMYHWVVAALLLSSMFPAYAQWTQEVKVRSVVVVSTGGINVSVEPQLTGCVSQSGYGASYASIYPNHPGRKAMHANLLYALHTGTPVRLYLTEGRCTVTEMILGSW
jgi:hypothetical protein